MTTLIVDRHIVDVLGPRAPQGIWPVPRRRRTLGRGAGTITREAAANALTATEGPMVVLARGARVDPDAAALGDAMAALGGPVITLPDELDAAAWSVGLAAALSGAEPGAVVRALEVLCCGPAVMPDAPLRPWGPRELPVPALRPVTLARWATRTWSPCAWCARGGAPGWPCRRCGAGVPTRPESEATS